MLVEEHDELMLTRSPLFNLGGKENHPFCHNFFPQHNACTYQFWLILWLIGRFAKVHLLNNGQRSLFLLS
jgi:hypothetical protein